MSEQRSNIHEAMEQHAALKEHKASSSTEVNANVKANADIYEAQSNDDAKLQTTQLDIKAQAASKQHTARTIYLQDYLQPAFYIEEVNLDIDLNEDLTIVTAILNIIRNPAANFASSPLVLDGENQELKLLELNGTELNPEQYTVSENNLRINSVGDRFKLKIVTHIRPQDNTALSGLYKSGSIFCTQCEAEGFRRLIYYIDRPDVMAKFTTTIRANKAKYPILLANGNLVAAGSLDDKRHFATWEDPYKKPSYLFAMVAGDLIGVFDTYCTNSGRLITLKLYVEHKNLDKTAHALAALKKAMAWDEKNYGREYDLDNYIIVAVDSFNMGAMENKGLNIFNSKYILAKAETATDDDFAAIDAVVGHEYFHNWSGNRVTLRDWFQLSLKEGFTVFREQQFVRDITHSPAARIEDVRLLRAKQFIEDAGSMAHPVQPKSYMEINNFYTVTVYEKGAEIIRMLHTLLGKEKFRAGTDLYFARYDGCAVTIEEFITAMEEVSGMDLAQFRLWYSQAGTPEIFVHNTYNSATKTYTLTLRQHCPTTQDCATEKLPMHIPIAIGLIDQAGQEILTQTLALKAKEQTFVFDDIPQNPVLSILRGFCAPVKIKQNIDKKTLALQVAYDNDEFNRWNAGQCLMSTALLESVTRYKKNEQLLLDGTLAVTFAKIISDANIPNALKGCMMQLPSDPELIDMMDIADPDAMLVAKNFILYELSKENKNKLLELYYDNRIDGVYKYNAKDMARRKLKNIALNYLMYINDQNVVELCVSQLHKANNMTDEIAALACIANHQSRERDGSLGYFYKKWQHEPLVVNKWLTVQARSELPDTLSNVKRLLNHQAFDLKNPNKVYALIGAFVNGNPLIFHDKHGNGYKFLADLVIELDALNPQVAARIISPFTNFCKFDVDRRNKIKQELQRIYNVPKLSSDILEIATKSLQLL